MKSVVILSCLLVLVAADGGTIFEQYVDFMNTAAKLCAQKLNMGDDIVKKFQTEKESTDIETVGCLKACVLKNFKMMEDGKLLINNIYEMIDGVSGDDPATAQKLKDMSAQCMDKVKDMTNECEVALNYINCCVAELKKF